jgi:outer membrane protein assembly factor BamA
MTIEQFRKKGKLKQDSKVSRDTVSNALTRLRKNYQKQNHLEATLKLDSHNYQPPTNHLNYDFSADRGPTVVINVDGASLSKGKIKNLVPVYEEGTVDDDLLHEGDRRIRDYFQRAGYFDVKASHTEQLKDPQHSVITFTVELGVKHGVTAVTLSGNKYFSNDTILPRLSVVKSSIVNRHGMYSQALAQADVNAITALYQSNGYSNVKVTPEVKDIEAKNVPGDKKQDAQISVKKGCSNA